MVARPRKGQSRGGEKFPDSGCSFEGGADKLD